MKIAFIGCGNMGGALVGGIVNAGAAKGENIILFDKDTKKMEDLAAKVGAKCAKSEEECAKWADAVFVCVKPLFTGDVAEAIKDAIQGKILISIAAGVPVKKYADIIGKDQKIVRTIPNLPAMVGHGITGIYFKNFGADCQGEIDEIKALFEGIGRIVVVKSEKMIDEMVSVTSSSPAYFCLIAEAMADEAVRCGFTRQDAILMSEAAMEGTAEYLLKSGKHPAVLKDEVCSPAGTTIEAVAELENSGLRTALQKAMEACRKKAVKSEEDYI